MSVPRTMQFVAKLFGPGGDTLPCSESLGDDDYELRPQLGERDVDADVVSQPSSSVSEGDSEDSTIQGEESSQNGRAKSAIPFRQQARPVQRRIKAHILDQQAAIILLLFGNPDGEGYGAPIPERTEGLDLMHRLVSGVERAIKKALAALDTDELRLHDNPMPLGPHKLDTVLKISSHNKDILVWTCAVLERLIKLEDKPQDWIATNQEQVWLNDAAFLFGRTVGLAYTCMLEQDPTRPTQHYIAGTVALLGDVQARPELIPCYHIGPCMEPHPLTMIQLKLEMSLSLHLGIWCHARVQGEILIVDILWPIQQALNHCQAKLRLVSKKLLIRACRSHRGTQSRAAKSIEVMSVTSYDSAINSLEDLSSIYTGIYRSSRPGAPPSSKIGEPRDFKLTPATDCVSYLETLCLLWMDVPTTLRLRLHDVGSTRYYNVPVTFSALALLINADLDIPHLRLMCELVPLMAMWRPMLFAHDALRPCMDLMIRECHSSSRVKQALAARALGRICLHVSFYAKPHLEDIFAALAIVMLGGRNDDAAYLAVRDIVEGLGPGCKRDLPDFLAKAHQRPIRESLVVLLTRISPLVPQCRPDVISHAVRHMDVFTQDGLASSGSAAWVALLKLVPELDFTLTIDWQDKLDKFLEASLRAQSTEVVGEALRHAVDLTSLRPESNNALIEATLNNLECRNDPDVLEKSLVFLQDPRLMFNVQKASEPLVIRLKTPNLAVRRVVSRLLNIQATRSPSLVLPIVRKYIRQILVLVDGHALQSASDQRNHLAVLCQLFRRDSAIRWRHPSAPPQGSRFLRDLSSNVIMTLESITHLAQFCLIIWNPKTVERTFSHLRRLARSTDLVSSKPVLQCMAAIMALPAELRLKNEVINLTFSDYLFAETTVDAEIKESTIRIVGAVGTADRNPKALRDANAAIRREESIYDAMERRRLATSCIRDKRGAISLDFQLSVISNVVVNRLSRRNLAGRLPVWTTILKLCLSVPDDRYTDVFPEILVDIVQELESQERDGTGTRSQRPKLLTLASQAILLKPSGHEQSWPVLLRLLQKLIQQPNPTSHLVWSILLVVLSILTRNRGDLTVSGIELLPVLQRAIGITQHQDPETNVFALRLTAVFQSQCTIYTTDLARQASKAVEAFPQHTVLVLEILRFFAHLVDFVSFYDSKITLEALLRHPSVVRLIAKDEEARSLQIKIRSRLTFSPVAEPNAVQSEYPDLRTYQDMQFSSLVFTSRKDAPPVFDPSDWETSDIVEWAEWQSWLVRLENNVIQASGSEVLKATAPLFDRVSRGLLQAAFVLYWEKLDEGQQYVVQLRISEMLRGRNTPAPMREAILSIVEFVLRGNSTRLPSTLLVAAKEALITNDDVSEKCNPLLLWYAELDCETLDANAANLSRLIEANIRIGNGSNIKQDDAAWSSIQLAEQEFGVQPKAAWLQALSRWDEALIASTRDFREAALPSFQQVETQIICHNALSDYQSVYDLVAAHYDSFSVTERRSISYFAAAGSWAVQDFESMAKYVNHHQKGSTRLLHKAVLDIHYQKYESAMMHITKAQVSVYEELQTRTGLHHDNDLSARNYANAIKILAKAEMLTELGEVVRYKQLDHHPDIQRGMRNAWQTRLKLSHQNLNQFFKRMMIWGLAAPPHELQDGWLHVAKMAHDKGYKSGRAILSMIGNDDQPGDKVHYIAMKFDWEDSAGRPLAERLPLIQLLTEHALILSRACGFPEGVLCYPDTMVFPNHGIARTGTTLQKRRLSRTMLRLGEWTMEAQGPDWVKDPEESAYTHHASALALAPEWYTANDQLATLALDLIEYHTDNRADIELSEALVERYALPALYALFQCILTQRSTEASIKATLLIITFWFKHGSNPAVLGHIKQHQQSTILKAWLTAGPQLIARLGAKDELVRKSLLNFLGRLALEFPDALIWSLLTAAQTPRSIHQSAAQDIMRQMSAQGSSEMVEQAQVISRELVRTAISFAERWRGNIEKLLYVDGLSIVTWYEFEEEYACLECPQTEQEYLFVMRFGDSLWAAKAAVERYFGGTKAAYHKACAEYQQIYRKLGTHLDTWKRFGTQLNLALVSPRLVAIQDSKLTVPGQYDPDLPRSEQHFIRKFEPMVDVLLSKQLPRKLVVLGDKDRFTYLLKGSEDLRQDQRILQLITLTNVLLNHNSDAFYRQLFLQPYNVVPLSPDSGLLSWVSNTETIMKMIHDSRNKIRGNRVMDNELAALMGISTKEFKQAGFDLDRFMGQYETLPLATKVARYRAALAESNHDDIKGALWRRSPNAQAWLSRRTCFARTIATNSMLGYIIGLGDRHPSNTLIEQNKFNAISIDFGDVFDAAAERPVCPEKVPFRLTPQITSAFELAATYGSGRPGSRGHFKTASLITMGVLRRHKETLLAMLEAFAYDPLLAWSAKEIDPERGGQKTVREATGTTKAQRKESRDVPPQSQRRIIDLEGVSGDEIRSRRPGIVNLGGSFIAPGATVKHDQGAESKRNNIELHFAQRGIIEEETLKPSYEESVMLEGAHDHSPRSDGGPVVDINRPGPGPAAKKMPVTETSMARAVEEGNGRDSYLAKMASIMTNDRALRVLNQIEKKLSGRDVAGEDTQTIEQQVQRLVEEATSHENLAQGYVLGWLPFW